MQATTRPLPTFVTQVRTVFPATANSITLNYLSAASLLLVVYTLYALLYRFVPYYQLVITGMVSRASPMCCSVT